MPEGTPGWAAELLRHGFDAWVPTVWLLEGLLMYLTIPEQQRLMRTVGILSAPGSAVFHDAISAEEVKSRIVVAGAPFLGGSDDYGGLWRDEAGFHRSDVIHFKRDIHVDRKRRRLEVFDGPSLTERDCRGQRLPLFVTAEKV